MNKKLQKQIKAYAGFAGVLLAADNANGQVVYVDINPDTLISAQPLNSGYHHFLLDVDIDGMNDFDFMVSSSLNSGIGGKWIQVTPQNSNQVGNKSYTFGNGINPYPAKLNYGDTISSNGNWRNNQFQELLVHTWGSSPAGTYGAWNVGSDNYSPFRLVQNSNYYYGWIRIEVIDESSILLKEYAYNTQPNIQLRMGHTTALSIPANGSPLSVHISQHNNSIIMNSSDHFQNAIVKVYDLVGKEILQQNFSGQKTEIKIDRKGIYFVEVKSEKGIFRKKVFIY